MASWLRVIGMLSLLTSLAACAPANQRYAVEIDPNIYIVQTGDTLESIAWRFRTKPSKLILWNNLDSGRLTIGQKILVRRPPNQSRRTTRSTASRSTQPAAPSVQVQVTRSAKPRSAATGARSTDCITCGVVARTESTPAPAKRPAPRPQATNAAASECQQPCGPGSKVDGVRWYWPADGRVVGRYAATQGLDVAGQEGQTVRAAASGAVVYAGPDMDDVGGLVIIEHNAKLLSTYAHVGKLLVRENDRVRAGQPIARMWKENTRQAKLHFEIRKSGKPVNPERYLPKR